MKFSTILVLFAIIISLANCNKDNSDGPSEDPYEGPTMIDNRDGQVYKIVDVGSQTWFAENLNYETPGSWLDYDSDEYGRYYLWEVALESCPTGWHLPSDDEWKTLEMNMGMTQEEVDITDGPRGGDVGKKLKSESGWLDSGNGTNDVGFNALPGGVIGYGNQESLYDFPPHSAHNDGYLARWLTSTLDTNYTYEEPITREIYSYSDMINRGSYFIVYKMNVRCVKD